MSVLLRALIYGSVFVSLVFVYVPSWLLAETGVAGPAGTGPWQIGGMILSGAGAVVVLWTVLAFALVGKGTPVPLDPPRRLVVVGPYRWVRNPMYLGAGAVLLGAAAYFRSWAVVAYCAALLGAVAVFIVTYEEPTLRRLFGEEYEAYCRSVRRWIPTTPAP
ncbi:MAG TPA: isoprenylcysteine carboxylmethyltransferase family protein, partial [bacterium]|nr:isoprenylcysteine carboxylmethyltransferase family protein [bacterium]